MKILYYNWTPLNVKRGGGGVAVYMLNLLQHHANSNSKDDICFLSSGYFYDHKSHKLYIREEESIYNTRIFSIINSPVIAPLACSLSSLQRQLNAEPLLSLFDKFIQDYGPFDVIHFQSFEGISTKLLELKEKHPATKFVHSIHDYGIFCPDVQFWDVQQENCFLKDKPHPCANCTYRHNARPFNLHIANRPSSYGEVEQSKDYPIIYKIERKIRKYLLRYFDDSKKFALYQKQNIAMINKYSDAEICVSRRVAEIAEAEGICEDKILVDYIGTLVADNARYSSSTFYNTEDFTILYMGYASVEKGFFYLLEVLESFTKEEAKKIRIKLAAQLADDSILCKLKERFKEVIVYNGYTKEDFQTILEDVNLGVVPPLWEDNLPQVSIEMIANGVPVITSKNGGAQELNNHPMFKFESKEDLKNKLISIQSNRKLLEEYWKYSIELTTMAKHVSNLQKIYKRTCKNS